MSYYSCAFERASHKTRVATGSLSTTFSPPSGGTSGLVHGARRRPEAGGALGPLTSRWPRAAARAGAGSGRATGDAGRRRPGRRGRGADREAQDTPGAAARSTRPEWRPPRGRPRGGALGGRGGCSEGGGTGRAGSTGPASEALCGCPRAGRAASLRRWLAGIRSGSLLLWVLPWA